VPRAELLREDGLLTVIVPLFTPVMSLLVSARLDHNGTRLVALPAVCATRRDTVMFNVSCVAAVVPVVAADHDLICATIQPASGTATLNLCDVVAEDKLKLELVEARSGAAITNSGTANSNSAATIQRMRERCMVHLLQVT
jgi:hypothetical protein